MENLEQLSRSELQALIKEHGLKGANKKTSDLQNILREYYTNPLTPSPSVDDLSPLETHDTTENKESVPIQEIQESISSSLPEEKQVIIMEEQDVNNNTQHCDVENLKEKLLEYLSLECVQTLESHELLDWELLKSMEFKDFSALGLKMCSFLNLRRVLKEKFPGKEETMVPLSEIKNIVQNILNISGIPKPAVSKTSDSNDSLKKIIKKPGKYDNVKSKVALQWNKSH